MNKRNLFKKLLAGSANIRFIEFVRVVEAFGFRLDRTSGSHRIYVHPKVREVLSLQSVNAKAKPYQIRQFLDLVEAYNLSMEDEE